MARGDEGPDFALSGCSALQKSATRTDESGQEGGTHEVAVDPIRYELPEPVVYTSLSGSYTS